MNSLKALFKGSKKGKDGGTEAEAAECRVSRDDFEALRLLGKGSFAKVLLVRHRETQGIYAMKVIVKESVLQHQRVQDVFTERGVLLRSNHPFLCKLHHTFQSDHKLFFVMDYYHGGDLDGYLAKQPAKKLKRSVGQLYGCEILLALQYLHSNGIVYRDLKPENVLMGADGHPCLSDFGLSKDFGAFDLSSEDRTASFVGSPFYVAPDVLRQKQYNNAVDYWSFGILLFRMLVGRPPFLGRSMKEVFDNILYQELRFSQSNPIDDQAMSIISTLLVKDPAKRAQGEAVKQHIFWSNLDWEAVYAKKMSPEGWIPPPVLRLEDDDAGGASPSASGGKDPSPKAVAATPAGAGPLAQGDQELFDGFTFTAAGGLADSGAGGGDTLDDRYSTGGGEPAAAGDAPGAGDAAQP